MIFGSLLLIAEGVSRTTFEWGRIQSNSDWILPVGICIAIMLFVRFMYRRDAVELPLLAGWLLTALRTAAFLGLLIIYLQPHWRLEREVVRNSKAILLVDTSLSMGLNDSETTGTLAALADKQPVAPKPGKQPVAGEAFSSTKSTPSSRLHRVAAMLEETDLIARLRKIHDVSVFQFNDDLKADRAVTFNKRSEPAADANSGGADANGDVKADMTASSNVENEKSIDWEKALTPSGTETRLGQALRDLIQKERGSSLSSIVIFSDGGQNAGISPESVMELARDAKAPIFTVGLGSDKQPKNVRVSDLIVPARAYPGDRYTVTGFLQARHMAGEVATVQVLSRPTGAGEFGRRHWQSARNPTSHAGRRRRNRAGQVRIDARRRGTPDDMFPRARRGGRSKPRR